ncbi:hypothetical protein P8452_07271 [Trifolium repens]|nr:hypothetical protein P8452_07271 [Trifolium repens]
MAQIFTLLIIILLLAVVTNGYERCTIAVDCPPNICHPPMIVKCIRKMCQCYHAKIVDPDLPLLNKLNKVHS